MRLPGWETRLVETVELYRSRPFEWGVADCVLYSCDIAAALTGEDPAKAFRGTYNDAPGALRVLKSLGCSNVNEAAAKFYEPWPCPHAFARRGDMALATAPSEEDPLGALGIVHRDNVSVYGPKGLHFIRRGLVVRTFKVG